MIMIHVLFNKNQQTAEQYRVQGLTLMVIKGQLPPQHVTLPPDVKLGLKKSCVFPVTLP